MDPRGSRHDDCAGVPSVRIDGSEHAGVVAGCGSWEDGGLINITIRALVHSVV